MFKGFRKISANSYGNWTDIKRNRFIPKSWCEPKRKREKLQVNNLPDKVKSVKK